MMSHCSRSLILYVWKKRGVGAVIFINRYLLLSEPSRVPREILERRCVIPLFFFFSSYKCVFPDDPSGRMNSTPLPILPPSRSL